MRTDHLAGVDVENVILAMSLELAGGQWKIALHDGRRQSPAVHTVKGAQASMRVRAILEMIERYKQKWSLFKDVDDEISVTDSAVFDVQAVQRFFSNRRHPGFSKTSCLLRRREQSAS
ncbi:hypothetical protein [Mycetohabitans endofungorum]|uniref:hypothetical protein n=1 Tax=Mycetohabitans endofungorum TaxID=417203 RepID=UPI0030CC6765